MERKLNLEIIGTLEKREKLASIKYNELVLESLFPYPGYHGKSVPDQTNPKSVFLVTKSKYPDELIIRRTKKVRKNVNETFDASPGTVTVFNEKSPCIRIKGLKNYKLIPNLIKYYQDEGISFAKGRDIPEYQGDIKILKYFLLDELDNGVYMDQETHEMGYFEIPTELDLDTFENITLQIKRNIKENNWDAAKGIFYRKKGLVDFIRIYDQNVCLGQCLYLMEKYNEEIERLRKDQQ